jgi:head-tail adaptor
MPDVIQPRLTEFSHRVSLCTMHDVVENSATMTLSREPVATIWAKIYALPNLPSFISPYGYAVKESQNRVTHRITMRYKVDLDFTSAAWVYEVRRKSPPRWYKVMGFYDNTPWIVLHAHLVEKSTEVTPPRNLLSAEDRQI